MRYGFRRPSFKKRIAARTSWKRIVRHSMGLKAPRGYGWLTNPKKAAYNRIYSRTSRGCLVSLGVINSGTAEKPAVSSTKTTPSLNNGSPYTQPKLSSSLGGQRGTPKNQTQ